MKTSYAWPAVRISAFYALFAGAWIVFSDQALSIIVSDPKAYATMQTYKGWFFVAVTALLLLALMCVELKKREGDRERLRILIAEKELLLFELDHRVKSNMQTTVGLIELNAAMIENPEDRKALAECAHSVRSMVMVHESLTRSEGLDRVELRGYLARLGNELFAAYDARRRGISLTVQGEDVLLDVERMILVGIMVTELVTNSLKHAFVSGNAGTVDIRLAVNEGELLLSVADDGVGLPEDVTPHESRSLGMTLLGGFAQQVGATLDIQRQGGTRVVLRLPLKA